MQHYVAQKLTQLWSQTTSPAGGVRDNIFIERLWRTVKSEDICLQEYASGADCRQGLKRYFTFFSHERPYQALDCRTPYEVHCSRHPHRLWATI